MSTQNKKPSPPMDQRCPLSLKTHPKQVCPLAVQRLKALENLNGNSSHMHESKLPGCEWALNDKESHYCFFKYIYDNGGKDHSTIEIAEKLMITQAAVYSGLNRALERIKDSDIVKVLKENYNSSDED